LGNHIRDAERAANLDELAARDEHLATIGQSVERQENSSGTVVDDRGRFAAKQLDEHRLESGTALATYAAFKVIFEVAITSSGIDNRVDCTRAQRRAPEIRVKYDTRRIDDTS